MFSLFSFELELEFALGEDDILGERLRRRGVGSTVRLPFMPVPELRVATMAAVLLLDRPMVKTCVLSELLVSRGCW